MGACSEPAQGTGSRVPSPPHGLLKPTVLQHSTFLAYSVVSEEASLCPPFDLDSVSWERKSRQNHAHFTDVETGQERPRLTREAGESEAGVMFSARGGDLHYSVSPDPKGRTLWAKEGTAFTLQPEPSLKDWPGSRLPLSHYTTLPGSSKSCKVNQVQPRPRARPPSLLASSGGAYL